MNDDRPGKKEIEAALKKVAGSFGQAARNTILGENYGKHIFEITSVLEKCREDSRVLDVGGGMGVNLLALRELRPSLQLHIVDSFDEYTEENRMGSAGEGLQLLRNSDIAVVSQDFWANPELPYETGYFDVITCLDVVEHLPGHPLKLLNEIYRILKNQASVILCGPNATGLLKRLLLLSGRYPYSSPFELWCSDNYFSHYREYTPDEYRRLLEMSRFDDIDTTMLAEPSNRYLYRNGGIKGYLVTGAMWILHFMNILLPGLRPTVYCIARKPKQ